MAFASFSFLQQVLDDNQSIQIHTWVAGPVPVCKKSQKTKPELYPKAVCLDTKNLLILHEIVNPLLSEDLNFVDCNVPKFITEN